MKNSINNYLKILNLQNAVSSLVEHEDAMVATVFKITKPENETLILKISERGNDYYREVLFLEKLKDVLPVPKIIQLIDPSRELNGAILMNCIPGNLLKANLLTDPLAYELGRSLAIIHRHQMDGYGDPVQGNLNSDPRIYFSSKFQEGLKECNPQLPLHLIEQCKHYFKNNIDLLNTVDGPCIVHRDFRPGNIIVQNGKLKGIIDWAGARASFAEEDFCTFEHGEWSCNSSAKNSFLKGYAGIRIVPDYTRLIPFLRLNKAIASIGFTIRQGTWKSSGRNLYEFNRSYIESLCK